MQHEPVNFTEKLVKVTEYWSPRVIAEMNDYQFKAVKLLGEFVWHLHEETDEVFIVLAGEMEIEFRDHSVTLQEGEMFVVPQGVEHITRAERECHALVIEPHGVVNTGDTDGPLTAGNDIWV